MLIEMTSPVFKEKGKVRPPIRFKEGLNVVLGKEDGENSIGKSSALLAIDFVFGGDTYLPAMASSILGLIPYFLLSGSTGRIIALPVIPRHRRKYTIAPRDMS